MFGVEFCDGDGNAVHGFKLIPESDFDVFFDWVRLHQACSVDDPEPFPYPVSAPAKERMIGSRVSDPGAVISVLAACCERLVAIEASIVNVARFVRDGERCLIGIDCLVRDAADADLRRRARANRKRESESSRTEDDADLEEAVLHGMAGVTRR